jgi:Uma2 family endonuclease
MIAQNRLVTLAEFEAFAAAPENDERRFELIDGEIVEKMPTELHGLIVAFIVISLGIYNQKHNLGRVTVEPRHKMPGDDHNVRLPDIAFTSHERALPVVEKGSVPQMPDLTVEVKSPDDTYTKMRNKAAYYLTNGVRMVWLIFPEKRLVEVYVPDADLQILNEQDVLEGGAVLPDFTMPVADIFRQ